MAQSISPWYAKDRSEWEASVQTWLADVAATHDLGGINAITTLKERPWSIVRRIEFTNGVFYFKACGAGGRVETQLLHFLKAKHFPELPDLIATELENDWLLMADGGIRLGDSELDLAQMGLLGIAVARYAALQIASAAWVDQLLGLGLPDRRVHRLPELLQVLLDDDAIGVGHSPDEMAELRKLAYRLLPYFEQICHELGDSPYAHGLDHGDLHMRNLLVTGADVRLIDWGDACVTHPFCSWLVTAEATRKQVPEKDRDSWMDYLQGAYLERWGKHYPHELLERDFERALWVGHICRALDFAHMFTGADEETLNQWRPMIFERLMIWVDSWNEELVSGIMPENR